MNYVHKMARRIVARHLLAIRRMSFYHGTAFKKLKFIAKKGLVAQSGALWGGGTALDRGTKAVYLTTDFELAARYAQGMGKSWVPVVLEVVISSPKRFRKLKYDPMDRHDSAWDIEDSYDDDADQTTRGIEKGISDVMHRLRGKEPPSYGSYLHGVSLPDAIEELDGINIYKFGARYLVKALGLDRTQRKRAIRLLQEEFGGREWEYLEVRPDGTLKLTEAYFYTREQLMYMKGLPPSTIKGVWVRSGDFDLGSVRVMETQEGGFKELPGESAQRFQDLQEMLRQLIDEKPSDQDEARDYADQARDLDYGELADFLDEVANMDPEEFEELDEFWQDEMFGFEQGLQDEWSEERAQESGTWSKVSLRDAVKLRPIG